MKVLVTGATGYIGSVLVPHLENWGHEVRSFDTNYYRYGDYGHQPSRHHLHLGDIREISRDNVGGVDAVIHLAALSNDAMGEIDSKLTTQINYLGSVLAATTARMCGVKRFIFMSSCSIYGVADGVADEQTMPNPLTTYARSKAMAEQAILNLTDEDFTPIILRGATVYGQSPRLRLDLVVNNMVAQAAQSKRIALTSDGTPWRPLLAVKDLAQTMVAMLSAPKEAVHGEVFNVGTDEDNYRVIDIANRVSSCTGVPLLPCDKASPDQRSYKVSFKKLRERLQHLRLQSPLDEEIEGMYQSFKFSMPEVHKYSRLTQLKWLIRDGLIDNNLYWTSQWRNK
jgi:nucleoside-diphosphate-sugar epimerase